MSLLKNFKKFVLFWAVATPGSDDGPNRPNITKAMEGFMRWLACTDCRSVRVDPKKRPDLQDLPHCSSPPYSGVPRVPANTARSAEGPSVKVTGERLSGLRSNFAPATTPVAHAESARLHEAGGHCYSWVQEMVKSNEEPGALVCAKTATILQVAWCAILFLPRGTWATLCVVEDTRVSGNPSLVSVLSAL